MQATRRIVHATRRIRRESITIRWNRFREEVTFVKDFLRFKPPIRLEQPLIRLEKF